MGATALPQHLVPRRRTSPSLHTNRKHPEGNDTSTNRPGQTARPATTVICAKPEFSRKVHTAHKRIHLRRESLAGGGGRGEAPPPIPGVPGRCTGQTMAGRDAATQPSGRGKPGAAQGRRSARGPRPAAPGPPTVGPHRGTCPGFEVESDFSCVRNKRPEMQTRPARLAERSSIRPPAPPLLVHQPADPDEAEGAGGLETGRQGHRTGPAPVSRGRGHRDLLLRLRTSASRLS